MYFKRLSEKQNIYPWLIRLFSFYNLSQCDLTSLFDQKLIVSFPGKRGNVGKESATGSSSASINGERGHSLIVTPHTGQPRHWVSQVPSQFWDTLLTCRIKIYELLIDQELMIAESNPNCLRDNYHNQTLTRSTYILLLEQINDMEFY